MRAWRQQNLCQDRTKMWWCRACNLEMARLCVPDALARAFFHLAAFFLLSWKVFSAAALCSLEVSLPKPIHLLSRESLFPDPIKSFLNLPWIRRTSLGFRLRMRIMPIWNLRATRSLQFLIVDVLVFPVKQSVDESPFRFSRAIRPGDLLQTLTERNSLLQLALAGTATATPFLFVPLQYSVSGIEQAKRSTYRQLIIVGWLINGLKQQLCLPRVPGGNLDRVFEASTVRHS